MNTYKSFLCKVLSQLNKHRNGIITLLYALLSSALLYYCLELGNKNPFLNGFFYTFVNILTIFVLLSAIFLVVQRWWISCFVLSLPVVALSIANYYTLMFRNSPISTQDIHNVGTTLSVIDSYSFPLTFYTIAIIGFFAVNIAVIIQLFKRERGKKITLKNMAAKNSCLLIFCLLFSHFVYFAENPIKPRNTFVWSWEDSYYRYGYAASSIEVFQNSMNMINTPDDYSEEALLALSQSEHKNTLNAQTPDIILILNETFYDLEDLVDIKTDKPVTPFIDSLSALGRAVVSGTGGGTNKSEYELLTSNSLQLMPAITPFNYLNFENANSIVSYLEALGYSTWGAHCAEALNYERGIVYPKLGFDTVLFDEDFGKKGLYEQRPYATDQFCYERMIKDYESMGQNPRFMYMLTIQNHGGWDLNPESANTVHTLTDFGEYTDDINEFLSCMQKSDLAFRKLTEYFEKSSRPVVICMVGDHAPSFATSLVETIDIETTFNLRSTPYVVWSNFDWNYDLPQNISMPLLVPSVLKGAGVSMSPFFNHIVKLTEKVPVITSFNLFTAADGKTYNYTESTEFSEDINIYFNMVYNNVSQDATRIDSIFSPLKK